MAVSEEGSFTLAARRILVTQSAVSHSLRTLEDQLGCKLLDRSAKKVVPTAEGELLLRRCRAALNEIEQVGRDFEGMRRWGQTRVRIGAPHSLFHYLLPSILREFRECFPRCELSIEVGDTAQLLEKMNVMQLDLVVGVKTSGRRGDGYRPMFKDSLGFVVSPTHPWAQDDSLIDASLHEQQFIIYAKATETHDVIDGWLQERGGGSSKTLVLGDMQAIIEMAKVGIGVGVVAPWVAAREIEEGSLILIEEAGPSIEREWGVFHSPSRNPSLVEEAFIGLCEMAFRLMTKA